MHAETAVTAELARASGPISPVVGLGRTIIAVAQASVFLFSDVRSFFVPVGGVTFEDRCDSMLGGVSLFCVGAPPGLIAAVSVVVLLVTASGFAPRFTCIPHAYVSLSFVGVLSLPDGGDIIASTVSLLFVFVFIGDPRLWHWTTGASSSAMLRGVSIGGQLAIRAQVAFIYFNSATAKFAVDTWADGSQMYYVTRQEMFGAAGALGDVARQLTAIPVFTLAATWGAIVLELCIALLVFVPKKNAARGALASTLFLHVLIIALIGIASFGLVMIGVVVCAVGARFDSVGDIVAWQRWRPQLGESIRNGRAERVR